MNPDFLPFEDAVRVVLAHVPGRLEAESVRLEDAARRVLVSPLVAPRDVPAESASLMDGYAVRAADVGPDASFRVAFEIAAGRAAPRALRSGECARIFTGAPIPEGADAVVMQERARKQGDSVAFELVPKTGEHVRARGSDARAGDALAPAGTVLDAGALSLVASLGVASVNVVRRPRVAILATGDELRPPGETLDPGCIYEANTYGLVEQARDAGGEGLSLGIARDDAAEIAQRLASADADILVTSGGASVGDYDFAREVLERLGGTKVFWQVAIRPGKPVLFGVIGRQLFFALPGNPGASALTFDLFVRPAIRALCGLPSPRRARVEAILATPISKPENLTFLARGALVARGAELQFRPAKLQGSMSIPSLQGLGAVAIVPTGIAQLSPGDRVVVEPWGPPAIE